MNVPWTLLGSVLFCGAALAFPCHAADDFFGLPATRRPATPAPRATPRGVTPAVATAAVGIAPAPGRTLPLEAAQRMFRLSGEKWSREGDALLSRFGDIEQSETLMTSPLGPSTSFRFGFKVKGPLTQRINVVVDDVPYSYTRGHAGNTGSLVSAPGRTIPLPGIVTDPQQWAALMATVENDTLRFYYNSKLEWETPLKPAAAGGHRVQAGFNFHDAQVRLAEFHVDTAAARPPEAGRLPGRSTPAPGTPAPAVAMRTTPAPAATPPAVAATGRGLDAPLAAKIKAAIGAGSVEKGELSGDKGGRVEVPPEGALLVGFDLTRGNFDGPMVKSLTPIYLTREGIVRGETRGKPAGRVTTIQAREGYAVGGLVTRQGKRVHGFEVIFMKINPVMARLDPAKQNTYSEEFLAGSGSMRTIGGEGKLIVGVYGASGADVDTVGLMHLP